MPLDPVAALVHEPVVVGTEMDEVREVGAPAVSPVIEVMRVQEAPLPAAGEAAGPVPGSKGPPERRRHAARLAANRQGPTVLLEDPDDRGVAGEPTRGLGMQGRAVL